MSKIIEIQDTELILLTNYYNEKLNIVRGKITELRKEEINIGDMLRKLNGDTLTPVNPISSSLTTPQESHYSTKDTIIGKVKYVLAESGREMTTSEIVSRLLDIDEIFRGDKNKTAKNVSTILSVNQGVGKVFKRRQDERNNNLFSLNK